MSVEVIGIDHVYLAVRRLELSEQFYDPIMTSLGFRKSNQPLGGEPHVHFYNRHFGFTLRPARPGTGDHDRFAPGLHHFCFRVDTVADVDAAAAALKSIGVELTEPRLYPEYAEDYYAIFFSDPDSIRLEITNFRTDRRERLENWEPPA